MTDEQVQEVWDAARKSVSVHCCDYHNHSAGRGCLTGPEDAVNVCRLAEAMLSDRAVMREAMKRYDE